MKRILILLLIFISFTTDVVSKTSQAFVDTHGYIRTANYYLMSGQQLDQPSTIKTLSQFDLIVIPLEAQVYNPTFFKTIRALNKNIIILAYVPTVSWNDQYWNDPIHQKLRDNIQPDWWLKDANGKQVSVWPGTRALNLNSGWSDYLPKFVSENVLSTGDWDGVFYDEVQDSISWVGTVDVNTDHVNDTAAEADSLWAKKYTDLFSNTRKRIGDKPLMLTNGSSNLAFAPYVNGRMYETFPSSTDSLSQWKNTTQDYLNEQNAVGYTPVNIINVNTDNTGDKTNYKKVRFGLTTTLLSNGYFGFDFGTQNHAQLWNYDEYSANLGQPKGSFMNTLGGTVSRIVQGVWQRDFERGRVVVNATDTPQTVQLNGEFEKLHGTQDPTTNDGSIVSEITLASKDGVILLRPIDQIINTTFRNGAFAHIFSEDGKTKRTGFFAYDNAYRGGSQIVHTDINHDGLLDTIIADATHVRVFDSSGYLQASFAPYTEAYTKGVNIAVGDIKGDGQKEIITGTLNGSGPQVLEFNMDGRLLNPGFFAFDKKFRGGVNVALGDLNGDGKKEIITAAAALDGSEVRIFKENGTQIGKGFSAYEKSFHGGVYVASGDFDQSGKDEIVTGKGLGGAPEVRVFDQSGKLQSSFFAASPTQRNGIKIAATDLDGDGISEIIALSTDVFTLSVFK